MSGNGLCLEGVMYGGGFVQGGFVRGGFVQGVFVRGGGGLSAHQKDYVRVGMHICWGWFHEMFTPTTRRRLRNF